MKISYSTLLIGDMLNSISIWIIEHYKGGFEEWQGLYKDRKDFLANDIADWFFLELSDMVDDQEIDMETLETMTKKFVKDNLDELCGIIKKLYDLNCKHYDTEGETDLRQ